MKESHRYEQLRLALKGAFGIERIERSFQFRQDDCVLISYPKSGNTWLRFIVAELLYPGQCDIASLERLVPDIYLNSHREIRKLQNPRYLKSHSYFNPNIPRGIIIVRDPRAVATSYFYHLQSSRKIPEELPFSEFLPAFIDGTFDKYGPWQANTMSWVGAKWDDHNFLFLRYEDMKADPMKSVKRISAHLQFDRNEEALSSIVENTRFEKLRQKERETGSRWKAKNFLKKPFFRKGETSSWKEIFTNEQEDLLKEAFERGMNWFGYD